ncbi:MAG: bacterioferritin [Gammaproteobacteria bacterium]|nr:bacterioferritin [Gammaproteobacteria bacterium]MDE2023195.1 bacterioferritin [Gammaproteobacteria bacterium]MDE2273247.1 bacterioferritin [Gammaproteobacteria bacterium]
MQGDTKAIQYLNRVLKNELTAINQYFLHSRMYQNWGLKELGEHERQESMEEMKHAERLVARILFLEGLPNLQDLGKLYVGEHVKEILECDLRLEMEAAPLLREAIDYCEGKNDYISRELFAGILQSEEDHIDWLETQLDLIARVGLENYTQKKI